MHIHIQKFLFLLVHDDILPVYFWLLCFNYLCKSSLEEHYYMLICVSVQICSQDVNFSTSLLSLALMDNLVITLSCSTVGESVSSLCVYLIFLLPSEHAQTFILNYLFLDKTISKDSASILYFLVILLVSIVIKVSISWICVNSFFTAFLPFSTNIPKNNQVVLLDHDISHHVLNCSAL